jgi:OmpA-OmpF porin, OOP family
MGIRLMSWSMVMCCGLAANAALAGAKAGTDDAAAADSNPIHWSAQYDRVEGGPEAELTVRVGSVSNLGFGWPKSFDPFSGRSTDAHGYPWNPPADAPSGLKRIMLGSVVTVADLDSRRHDGYSAYLRDHDVHVQPITVPLGALPAKIDRVLFQLFIDDFQAPSFDSRFQMSINGTRIPGFEQVINTVDQTGPVGKLVSMPLLPEYFPLLRAGTLTILIDDPVTHMPDGYAVDFVRVLINPLPSKYVVEVRGTVRDADTSKPIAGATVSSALASAQTGPQGDYRLAGVPAGLVVAEASHEGYTDATGSTDVESGKIGHIDLSMHRTHESAATLEAQVEKTGTAVIYGIHFDLDKATLRPDSTPALEAVLSIMQKNPAANWIVSGHTDNTGTPEHNAPLSLARAKAVCQWLENKGVDTAHLQPKGFGADHPVADNATANGRALNRRVELQHTD